jgi:hypothetical protein
VSSSFVVLVEGRNDREVCRHLLGRHSLHFRGREDYHPRHIGVIRDAGSYSELIDAVPVEIKHDPDLLAIVVDADTDIGRRWESLRSVLRGAGYQGFPDRPNSVGTIVRQEGMPLAGVWIMPNNASTGILEDFAATLIPKDDALWPRVQQCVDSIPLEQRSFPVPKAKIHTWLAWQEEPGTRMGEAINKRYLDAQSPHALPVCRVDSPDDRRETGSPNATECSRLVEHAAGSAVHAAEAVGHCGASA